jgi:hypothetical protein
MTILPAASDIAEAEIERTGKLCVTDHPNLDLLKASTNKLVLQDSSPWVSIVLSCVKSSQVKILFKIVSLMA